MAAGGKLDAWISLRLWPKKGSLPALARVSVLNFQNGHTMGGKRERKESDASVL
jgi:hypothetical protein